MNCIKIFLILSFTIFCNCIFSQEKKISYGINASIGGFQDKTLKTSDDNGYSGGASFRIGYWGAYIFGNNWELKSGIDIIYDDTSFSLSEDDVPKEERLKDDIFGFLHIPIIIQYNLGQAPTNRNHWSVGVGPSLNITILNDQYKYKDNKMEKLNGRNKLRTFNMGIQAIVSYTFHKKFSFSFDCNFGLLNMKKNYNIGTGKKYLYHFWPTFSYQF